MKWNSKYSLTTLLFSTVITLTVTSAAQSATITFNGTAGDGQATTATGQTYSEDGYSTVIGSGGASFFVDNDLASFPGVSTFDDDVLEFNSQSLSSFELTKDDGGLFDLFSVKTGSLGRDSADDGNFIFTGLFGTGGSITQTLLGSAIPNITMFSGWIGLLSLNVTSTDGLFPVIDDIVVDTSPIVIPVPAALPLLASGLAFFGFMGWRKKRNAAA